MEKFSKLQRECKSVFRNIVHRRTNALYLNYYVMLELKKLTRAKMLPSFKSNLNGAFVLSQFKFFEFSSRKYCFQKQMSYIRTFDVVPKLKPCTQGRKRVCFQIFPVSSVLSFDIELH